MKMQLPPCHVVFAISLCLWLGCSSAPADPSPDAASSDTAMPTHTRTSSAKYEWSVPAEAPARNAACGPADSSTYGPSLPWQGFTHQDKTYTCNRCPGGDPVIQGSWRAVFDETDPTLPYDQDPTYQERLIFDGNRFTMDMDGKDLGEQVRATVTGWYFCSAKPETGNASKFFILTSVEPEGAFGWETGMVFTADLLSNELQTALFFGWYPQVVTQGGENYGGTQPYCRTGTLVGEKPCDDPFQ